MRQSEREVALVVTADLFHQGLTGGVHTYDLYLGALSAIAEDHLVDRRGYLVRKSSFGALVAGGQEGVTVSPWLAVSGSPCLWRSLSLSLSLSWRPRSSRRIP